MSLEEEVFRIGKQLVKIAGKDAVEMDTDASVDLLKNLKDLPITLEVLQKTRIGMSVNTLRKKSNSTDVQSIGKSLIKSWKKLLPEKDGKVDNNRVSSNEVNSGSNSPALSTQSSDSTETKDNKVVSVPNLTITANSVRGKCREMIVNSLKIQGEFEAVTTPVEFAAACEEAIFKEFGDTNTKYKQRIRSRVSNLRDMKNPMLKVKVLGGDISHEEFAVMSTEEMASDEMKKLRQQITKDGIRDAQVAKNEGTTTSLFKCMKCRQRKTTYNQLQTRSADEPMTTFVLCLHCGNRWKFC